jgi:hypothetical protein
MDRWKDDCFDRRKKRKTIGINEYMRVSALKEVYEYI